MTELRLPLITIAPDDDTPKPGVIVIHEGNGITPQMIRCSEQLAREGYLVVVPDFFFRMGGPEATAMKALIHGVTPEDRHRDLVTAVAHLRTLGATSVGIVGFCMGGTFAYAAGKAARELGVDAIAAFYGAAIIRQPGELECPALLAFAGRDRWISLEEIDSLRDRHGDDIVVYEGVPHGFMRDGSDDFREEAADDAWRRLLAHFSTHLA